MYTEEIKAPRNLKAGDFFVKSGHVALASRDADYLEEGVKVTWGGVYMIRSEEDITGPVRLVEGYFVPAGEEAHHGQAIQAGEGWFLVELLEPERDTEEEAETPLPDEGSA